MYVTIYLYKYLKKREKGKIKLTKPGECIIKEKASTLTKTF